MTWGALIVLELLQHFLMQSHMNTDDDTRLEQLADETALKSSGVMLVYRAPIILAALHKAVEPYRRENDELREIIEVLKASHSDFNTACVQLNEENAALMKQVGDLKVELASAQDRYEEAERNTAAWNNSFHAANTDRLQLQAENDRLKQQIDELSCKAALRRQEAPMDRKE